MTSIVTSEMYTKELLRAHPDKLFIFGDNMENRGKGGQAVIRDEPNAYGIATKHSPHTGSSAYFSNDDLFNQKVMYRLNRQLELLDEKALSTVLVFPTGGLGTGLSAMPEYCPKLFAWLGYQLALRFNVLNTADGLFTISTRLNNSRGVN